MPRYIGGRLMLVELMRPVLPNDPVRPKEPLLLLADPLKLLLGDPPKLLEGMRVLPPPKIPLEGLD